MKRRQFLKSGALAGAALLHLNRLPPQALAMAPKKFGQDLVTLGRTGIRVARLAQPWRKLADTFHGMSQDSRICRSRGEPTRGIWSGS